MHLRAGNPDAADADLERALELAPADARVAGTVADAFARRARWVPPAAAWEKARAANPELAGPWIGSADASLARGDREAYRRLCAEMLRRFVATTEPRDAANVALRCLLLPDAVEDRAALARLAGRAAEPLAGRDDPHPARGLDRPRLALVRALAEYPAGHPEAAGDWLTWCDKHLTQDMRIDGEDALVFFCRALVEHRQGHADAPRTALDQGRRSLARRWPQGDLAPDVGPWPVWVHAEALRAEAEALLKTDRPAANPRD